MQPQMQPEPQAPAVAAPSSLAGLATIFYAPGDTFSPSMKRPWLVPLIAATLLALLVNVMVINVMGMGTIVRNSIEANPRMAEQLGPDGVNQAVQRAENSSVQKVMSYVGSLVGLPLILVITAGVTLGVLMLTGGNSKFSAVLGAVSWATYATLVVYAIGTAVFLAAVNDFRGVDARNLVMLNASIFMDPQTSSKPLRALAGRIDLIGFWGIFLQTVGLAKLSERVSTKQALTAVIAVYILWSLGAVGFSFIF